MTVLLLHCGKTLVRRCTLQAKRHFLLHGVYGTQQTKALFLNAEETYIVHQYLFGVAQLRLDQTLHAKRRLVVDFVPLDCLLEYCSLACLSVEVAVLPAAFVTLPLLAAAVYLTTQPVLAVFAEAEYPSHADAQPAFLSP